MKPLQIKGFWFRGGWFSLAAAVIGLILFVGAPAIPTILAEEEGGETANSESDEEAGRAEGDAEPREDEPRSFTDEDLEKYHRPKPEPEEDERGETGAAAQRGAKGAGKPGSGTQTKRRPPRPSTGLSEHAPLVRSPLKIATPPSQDPLKSHRDRAARERFRTEQIQALRDRIAVLEKRLDYLRRKRLAVVNPLYLMPEPPAGDAPDDDAGMKPKELLERIEAEIVSTGDEIAVARENLVEIETRFGHEANLR